MRIGHCTRWNCNLLSWKLSGYNSLSLYDMDVPVGRETGQRIYVLTGAGPMYLQFVDPRGCADAKHLARIMTR